MAKFLGTAWLGAVVGIMLAGCDESDSAKRARWDAADRKGKDEAAARNADYKARKDAEAAEEARWEYVLDPVPIKAGDRVHIPDMPEWWVTVDRIYDRGDEKFATCVWLSKTKVKTDRIGNDEYETEPRSFDFSLAILEKKRIRQLKGSK